MTINDQYIQISNQLRFNQFKNRSEKLECIHQMIELAIKDEGRISLCRTGICDFICDALLSEKSVECMTNLCVLIGYLGISDTYRPALHSHDVANILINSLELVDNIKDKLNIIQATRNLCQTKNDAVILINAGIIPHLCNTLKCVDTNEDKKMVSYCIFWVSYLAGDKTTALQHGCIELMYEAAESISNKPMQSNIFLDMDHFDIPHDNQYPIYKLWKTNFEVYCDETVH